MESIMESQVNMYTKAVPEQPKAGLKQSTPAELKPGKRWKGQTDK